MNFYVISYLNIAMAQGTQILPLGGGVCVWVSEWVSEWVGGWVSEWVSERASERASLTVFLGQRTPCGPYKPCNHSLYIGIIIFPHIN